MTIRLRGVKRAAAEQLRGNRQEAGYTGVIHGAGLFWRGLNYEEKWDLIRTLFFNRLPGQRFGAAGRGSGKRDGREDCPPLRQIEYR